MKKVIFAVFVFTVMTVLSVSVFAGADVYVTVSDGSGTVTLSAVSVTVNDVDGDGSITIDEALYSAHEQYYSGGADAGYKSYLGQYGIALEKLWGVSNGGSYSYYVNNSPAMSLSDPIKSGDYIAAFAYSDLVAWSDSYSWFEEHHTEIKDGEKITLKLSSAGYDENFNPVVLSVRGAVITVDGERTEYVTDENGNVTVELTTGEHLISAVSDAMTLVPPVCIVNVVGSTADAPVNDTGLFPVIIPVIVVLVAAAAVLLVVIRRRVNHEK